MSLFENDYDLFGFAQDIDGFILQETTVAFSKEMELKAAIEVRPKDARFKMEPYIKICKNTSKWELAKVNERTRISLKKPEYIHHDSDPGKWKLNSREKKILMTDLTSPYKRDPSKTLWDAIIEKIYIESDHECDLRGLQVPDYTLLK